VPVGTNRLFVIGKSGFGFGLSATALGGVGGQVASLQICPVSPTASPC
jgi:hypothetical protein